MDERKFHLDLFSYLITVCMLSHSVLTLRLGPDKLVQTTPDCGTVSMLLPLRPAGCIVGLLALSGVNHVVQKI